VTVSRLETCPQGHTQWIEDFFHVTRGVYKAILIQQKCLYSKEESSSSKESDESISNSEREETLFMAIETKIDEDKGIESTDSEEEKNFETDGEVSGS
jgi:hypothetical protein